MGATVIREDAEGRGFDTPRLIYHSVELFPSAVNTTRRPRYSLRMPIPWTR